jgi:DNA polymerase family A/3'-5' exonuclease
MIFLDFETYYKRAKPNKYSISGSTNEEYVRDPKFQTIGFSYAIDDAPAVWVTGTDEYMASVLRSLPFASHIVCAHNARFDAFILSHHYGIHPLGLVDTMLVATVSGLRATAGGSLAKLAKILDIGVKGEEIIEADGLRREQFPPAQLAKYGEYCCNDTELCRRVFKILAPAIPRREFHVIDMTLKMYTNSPFLLDVPLLEARLTAVQTGKDEARAAIADLMGVSPSEAGAALRSADKFAEVLRAHGVEPGLKESTTAPGEMIYAFAKTDKFMEELLDHPDPRVVVLAEARLGERSNIEETRLERFIDIGKRGGLPIPLAVSAAHTHRYGGDDKLNLQNLPKRGGRDLTLRRAIIAPPGHIICGADSSQIEVRTLAYIANDMDTLATLQAKQDPYTKQAALIYDRPEADIAAEHAARIEPGKTQRAVAKEVVLACGYGVGHVRLQDRLRVSGVAVDLTESKLAVTSYRNNNPAVIALWRLCGRVLDAMVARETGVFGGPIGNLFSVGAAPMLGREDVSPYIGLPDGNKIWYHGLAREAGPKGPQYNYWQGKININLYSAKLVENLSQALAFAVLKWQALRLREDDVPVHFNCHDEWVSVVPSSREAEVVAKYASVMSTAPAWAAALPLACEVGVSTNYGDI